MAINTINGTNGDDTLGKATPGADKMIGKKGNDTYHINNAGDSAVEQLNEGTDKVISSINYLLATNIENLTLIGIAATGTGNSLKNVIIGNAANNTLDGRANDDDLQGGKGDDTLMGGASNDSLAGGADNDTLKGDMGTDILHGNMGSDWLEGGTGHDTLYGDTGHDTLTGGSGNDTLYGGFGNDIYYVDAQDKVVELVGQGYDTARSFLDDYTLGSNFEALTLLGTAIKGTGNELNNVITGNNANNTLSGLAGNDTLIGGEGTDTLIGGTGKDTYDLTETGHSADTVVVGLNTTAGILENLANFTNNVDTVKGFVIGEDKLDVEFNNIVADVSTLTSGNYNNADNVDRGAYSKHTITNGIYKLFDSNNVELKITTALQIKQAAGYIIEDAPLTGSIAGFHVTNAAGTAVTNTFVIQHDHSTATPPVENHIIVDLVGLASPSGLNSSWIV